MDTLTLLISLLLTGGVLALVLYPLWQRQTRSTAGVDRPGQSFAEHTARYQAALAAIRDLMFDYDMGKISAEDYPPLLQKAKYQAAHLRQQLDLPSGEASLNPATDAKIEAAVAALKNSQANAEAVLQPQVEALKQKVCPRCGHAVQPSDAFCAKCGMVLSSNISTRK